MTSEKELRDAYEKGPITDQQMLQDLNKMYPQVDSERLHIALTLCAGVLYSVWAIPLVFTG